MSLSLVESAGQKRADVRWRRSRDLRVMCVGGGSDEIMTDLGLRMAEKKMGMLLEKGAKL